MQELTEKKVLNRISEGLFSWIDFKENANILCIDEDLNSLSFLDCKNQVKYISNSKIKEQTDKYDYILWRRFDEIVDDIEKILNIINSLLKENGVAYLGFTNKNSIRRECGDINFVGKYSKNNIFSIFNRTSFSSVKIFSVFPDVFYPQYIISSDFLPNENMRVRYFPLYDNPNDINVDEPVVLDYLISNKKLHDYANCYLVECCKENRKVSKYQYITLSMDRVDDYACNTIIADNYVIKKYPFSPADLKKKALVDNEMYLQKHNVPIAKSVPDIFYKVPFYNAKVLTNKLYELLINDINSFYDLFDRYRDIVYSSSDIIKMDKGIPILRRCYIDLVPLNCLWVDGDFVFIDQEFFIDNLSANVIIWRAIKILYISYPDITKYILEKDLLTRYGINDSLAKEYNLFSNNYIDKLRNKDVLNNFYKKHTISLKKLEENIYKIGDTKMTYLVNKIEESSNKKYNIGYIAGVFDLFHIGHLNLLKRAKEMCNHLIVGVVSDRGVTEYKKVELFIPFEERIEIVRSCRYVDEAHEIPFEHPTTIDAFNMYHFDVQFSGDDYINDLGWLYMKDFLEKNGSEMVFLPYTKTTSSTKIKNLINKKE